jgi:hypothetical protein
MANPKKIANCSVLGDGASPEHFSHVAKTTPRQTKVKEIKESPQYQSEAMDPKREKAVTKARRYGDVRPLGGGVAE